ncbi:MAG: hypothetical protein AABX65_01350, partial [Nanoarchaeota archaeon]
DRISKIECLEDRANLDISNLRNVKEYAAALLPLQEDDLEALKAYAKALSISDKDAEAHLNLAMLLERYEMPWPSYLLLSEGIKLDAPPDIHCGFHAGLFCDGSNLRNTRLSSIPPDEMEKLLLIHAKLTRTSHKIEHCFFLSADFNDKDKREGFYKTTVREIIGEDAV